MKKNGKSGRPGKRRRNMPGYYLGINKIGHKSWFASRRPQDIDRNVSKNDFLSGSVEPGAIFAVSKKSNVIFLGLHQGRILYYNPKTDRVSHTGLGRGDQNATRISILKEKAGLDYFKSEKNWMNHRKIPGSDLRVSDILTNPYRKTIAKKVGDKFTMLDYHESAVVGDIPHGEISDLKAEVIAITKKGIAFRVFDGTPGGRQGHMNLKNPRLRDREYTLVKSAVNQDLEVKDLQKKVKDNGYNVISSEKGGTVAVGRGRPAGSTNRPLTEEEKKVHREKTNKHIEELDELPDDDILGQLSLVKKIISHSNKAGDEEINKKYKKIRQQLNYKAGLHEKYDEADTPKQKLEAAKAALKYEERTSGRDSAIKMWKDRIESLSGKKDSSDKVEDPIDKKIDETKDEIEKKPDENSFESEFAKKIEEYKEHPNFKTVYDLKIEDGEPLTESEFNTINDIVGRILENDKDYHPNQIARYLAKYKAHKDLTSENPSDEVSIAKKIKEYQLDSEFKNIYNEASEKISLSPHFDLSDIAKRIENFEKEISTIPIELRDEGAYTSKEYKEKLARYSIIKKRIKLFKEQFGFLRKFEDEANQHIASGDESLSKTAASARKSFRSDYEKGKNQLIKIISTIFGKLYGQVIRPFAQEIKEGSRGNYLIMLKAAKEAFKDKQRQDELNSEIDKLKNDPGFDLQYKIAKESLKDLDELALRKKADEFFTQLVKPFDKNDLIDLSNIAAFKSAIDLLKDKNNEKPLSELDFVMPIFGDDDPLRPYHVNQQHQRIIKAVKSGLQVIENVKKKIPMFNSWEGDKVDGQEIRKRLNEVTVNTNWLLSPTNKNNEFFLKLKEEEFDNKNEKIENSSYQVLFSRIKERSDRLEQEIINLRKKLPPPNLTRLLKILDNVEPTDEEKIIKKEINLLYSEKRYLSDLLLAGHDEHANSVKSELKKHLDSSPQTKFENVVEFKGDNLMTEKEKQDFKTKIEKSMDFIKKMLCERGGEFIVKFNVEKNDKTRANFSNYDNAVKVSSFNDEWVIVHEVAHKIEYLYPEAKKMCIDFVKKRTEGESLVSLKTLFPGSNYGEHEMTRPDNFIDPYIGKLYHINGTNNWSHNTAHEEIDATEVLSMGLQYMFQNPLDFMSRDPEHFDLVWKIMRGGGKAVS